MSTRFYNDFLCVIARFSNDFLCNVTHFSSHFRVKSAAKVLYLFEMSKYFKNKMQKITLFMQRGGKSTSHSSSSGCWTVISAPGEEK